MATTFSENYYKVLDIDRSATQEEIDDSFKKISKEKDPSVLEPKIKKSRDKYLSQCRVNGNEPSAIALEMFENQLKEVADTFQKVKDAYKVLSNPDSKKLYDEYWERTYGLNATVQNISAGPSPANPIIQRGLVKTLAACFVTLFVIFTICSVVAFAVIKLSTNNLVPVSEMLRGADEPTVGNTVQSAPTEIPKPIFPSSASDPQWSADGAFISWKTSKSIFVMTPTLSSSIEIQATLGNSEAPVKWSPDKNEIAYFYADLKGDNSGIWVAGTDGKTQAVWHSKDIDPSKDEIDFGWSPDGKQIFFAFHNELYSVNRNGKSLKKIDFPTSVVRPAWSPDGTHVAFETAEGGETVVVVTNIDGTSPVIVPKAFYAPRWISATKLMAQEKDGVTTVIVEAPFTGQSETELNGRNITLSPNEKAYLAYVSDKLMLGKDSISATVPSAYAWSAAWSPDGSMFALSIVNNAYLYNADGTLIRQLTK